MNQKAFIYVSTDGSCVSATSTTPGSGAWNSDRGRAGVLYMLAFDPAGVPATNGTSLGHFDGNQEADNGFITGGNPALAAAAIVANYLKFSGKEDLIKSVLPSEISGNVKDILKFT